MSINKYHRGFSIMELLVVIAIIGILAGVIFASFGSARATARDEIRKTDLKQLQLAIEMYRAQNNGSYPPRNTSCSTSQGGFTATNCYPYIIGLTPDYISQLPRDPSGQSYRYRTNGTSYKLITERVEISTVPANYAHDFARCPSAGGSYCPSTAPANTYGIYGGPASANW